jgi:NUMOD4 motif/HNH endonuclease
VVLAIIKIRTPATADTARGRGRLVGVDVTERICSVNGCERPHRARGWCSMHYKQWLSTGTVEDFSIGSSTVEALVGERWRPVRGYEGFYDVSDFGRVRSVDRIVTHRVGKTARVRGRLIAQVLGKDTLNGMAVSLWLDGTVRTVRVHRLVLTAFVGECPPGMECCHDDGNATNNMLANLRWDTHSENILDRQRHGTDPYRNRTHCPRRHRLTQPNLRQSMLRNGYRACRACHRAGAEQQVARKRGELFDFQAVSDIHYARIMREAAA